MSSAATTAAGGGGTSGPQHQRSLGAGDEGPLLQGGDGTYALSRRGNGTATLTHPPVAPSMVAPQHHQHQQHHAHQQTHHHQQQQQQQQQQQHQQHQFQQQQHQQRRNQQQNHFAQHNVGRQHYPQPGCHPSQSALARGPPPSAQPLDFKNSAMGMKQHRQKQQPLHSSGRPSSSSSSSSLTRPPSSSGVRPRSSSGPVTGALGNGSVTGNVQGNLQGHVKDPMLQFKRTRDNPIGVAGSNGKDDTTSSGEDLVGRKQQQVQGFQYHNQMNESRNSNCAKTEVARKTRQNSQGTTRKPDAAELAAAAKSAVAAARAASKKAQEAAVLSFQSCPSAPTSTTEAQESGGSSFSSCSSAPVAKANNSAGATGSPGGGGVRQKRKYTRRKPRAVPGSAASVSGSAPPSPGSYNKKQSMGPGIGRGPADAPQPQSQKSCRSPRGRQTKRQKVQHRQQNMVPNHTVAESPQATPSPRLQKKRSRPVSAASPSSPELLDAMQPPAGTVQGSSADFVDIAESDTDESNTDGSDGRRQQQSRHRHLRLEDNVNTRGSVVNRKSADSQCQTGTGDDRDSRDRAELPSSGVLYVPEKSIATDGTPGRAAVAAAMESYMKNNGGVSLVNGVASSSTASKTPAAAVKSNAVGVATSVPDVRANGSSAAATASSAALEPAINYPLAGPFVQGLITGNRQILETIEGDSETSTNEMTSKLLLSVTKMSDSSLETSTVTLSIAEMEGVAHEIVRDRRCATKEAVQFAFIEMKKRHDTILNLYREQLGVVAQDEAKMRSTMEERDRLAVEIKRLQRWHEEEVKRIKREHERLVADVIRNHQEEVTSLKCEIKDKEREQARALDSYRLASSQAAKIFKKNSFR